MELLSSNQQNPFSSWSDLYSSIRLSLDQDDLKHYQHNPNTLKLLLGDQYMKDKPIENMKTLHMKQKTIKQRAFKVVKTGVLYIAVVLSIEV